MNVNHIPSGKRSRMNECQSYRYIPRRPEVGCVSFMIDVRYIPRPPKVVCASFLIDVPRGEIFHPYSQKINKGVIYFQFK